MNFDEARYTQLVYDELEKWNITNYQVKWNRSKINHGEVIFSKKTITFSRLIYSILPLNHFMDTVRHEIAHILALPHCGHGYRWIEACNLVSALPNPESDPLPLLWEKLPPKWLKIAPDRTITQLWRKVPVPEGYQLLTLDEFVEQYENKFSL